MRPTTRTLAAIGAALATAGAAFAQTRERSEVPEAYTWDLTPLYPTDDAWRQAKEKIAAELPAIDAYKGTLAQSPARLLACLELVSRLSKDFRRAYAYAAMASDVDTRDSKRMAMKQELDQLGTEFSARTAFIDPEILAMDPATVESFIAREKGLAPHAFEIRDTLRRKAHTGTPGEERILAEAGLATDAAASIYRVFSDADFPDPEVTLADGTRVTLDKASFSLHRASPVREDRKRVFEAFFGRMNEYRRTFGASLYATVKSHMFYARARNYGSSLERALDGPNVPVAVYRSLVDSVNRNLPTLHRYLELRARMLGIDELHYYDLYAPLVASADLHYEIEPAQNLVLASFKPLGTEYVATVERAFRERWLDFYPSPGKRSGAYSNGSAYDVHPYMLLNYNGRLEDVGTLAHELGHTMHSWYSNRTQPYPTARYVTFVAEVASTFNEALLNDHLLRTVDSEDARLSILGQWLEEMKGTLFRQTQFAEFELAIHELAEKGEALTGDRLDELYLALTRKYYGHDRKSCIVDDHVKAEWAFIPHFYLNFYVYQYATSVTASTALAEKVLAGDAEARRRYLEFLSAGGSDYPIELLRRAGVDMTTSEPFDLTIRKMNRVMDEMTAILDRRAGKSVTTGKAGATGTNEKPGTSGK